MKLRDEDFQDTILELNIDNLTPRKNVVRAFYKDMWDHADITLIPDLFHADFTFRGSLGPRLVGHQQFAEYVKWVTQSIEGYTSDIYELIEEGNKISAKLIFHGVQRLPMFGIAPTNAHVWWYGAPVFTFEGDKVKDLWVLGDIHGLLSRAAQRPLEAEFAL
ncbi:ester cyclase [Pseudomonas typographi]|uniref:ester cyclase n=1 Tax=Pseudomonas typographi TaxID=2715964 RepID=UPI0016895E47|nr:ester cyclase [Pseudomonas typographi]MBD1554473.1 ester cyclase [Pseudomonas typographi]